MDSLNNADYLDDIISFKPQDHSMKNFDETNKLRTGDTVLFSSNSPTGFLLRTFTSTEWNHSGIAVRFIKTHDSFQISLSEEGELYILETNTGIRHDPIFNCDMVGAGFSKADWVFKKYNRVKRRPLRDIFRNTQLAQLTLEFAKNNKGSRFPSSSLPFISVWLGVHLHNKDPMANEMFCSELMANYYNFCIGPQYEKMTGIPYDGKLSRLFGSNGPSTEDMFTPEHYTNNQTPNACIFSGKEELILQAYADLYYIILQPFILILFIMLVIWMSLPK